MNKQKTKYHLRKRMFLNRFADMPAFVIGIVEDTRDVPDENENACKWGEMELTLADCHRRVAFSFDLSTSAKRANSLYQIRRIAAVINEFQGLWKLKQRRKAPGGR